MSIPAESGAPDNSRAPHSHRSVGGDLQGLQLQRLCRCMGTLSARYNRLLYNERRSRKLIHNGFFLNYQRVEQMSG
jgi:hypothetical protein